MSAFVGQAAAQVRQAKATMEEAKPPRTTAASQVHLAILLALSAAQSVSMHVPCCMLQETPVKAAEGAWAGRPNWVPVKQPTSAAAITKVLHCKRSRRSLFTLHACWLLML